MTVALYRLLAANWITASLSLYNPVEYARTRLELGAGKIPPTALLSLFYSLNTPIDKGFHQLLFFLGAVTFMFKSMIQPSAIGVQTAIL